MTRLSHLALKKDKKIHDHLKLPIQMTQSTFLQNEKVSRLSRGNRGDEKKRTSKVIKLRYLFPEMVRQSSKGRRVIAATDYFTTATLQLYFILAMCLIPFHSPNGPSDWLSALFWKRPTKLLKGHPPSDVQQACPANRPSCFQTAQSFPSPVEQHSLTSASTSASTARAPAPAPAWRTDLGHLYLFMSHFTQCCSH